MTWKPRGVLKASPAGFEHVRFAPAPELAPFVEHFWGVAWDLEEPVVRETLPHPSVHVLFERGHSGVGFVSRKRWARTLSGRGQVLGVKFHPGCFRPFYPRRLSELTGRVLPISRVFGRTGAALQKRILGSDLKEGARFAEAFLLERLPLPDPQAVLAREVVGRILADPRLLRAEAVAAVSGLTLRSLQRLFSDYVGIGPKWVIQRYRLHEAVARLDEGKRVDFAQLALDLGYADQAHFIRDFKSLVGRTPQAYARQSGEGG
jgi:AraC-like DNA-binding protein